MTWNIRTSRQTTPDLEILKFPHGIETAASVVLDASAVAPDADGKRVLKAGTLLSKNTNNQYERFTAAGAANEVTTIDLTGVTDGVVRITVDVAGDDQTTADIAFDAAAAAIDAALEALSNVDAVTVVADTAPVAGVTGGAFTVTVTDPGNQDVTITVDTSDATGDAEVDTTTEGDVAQAIRGVLAHTVEFVDGTSKSDQPAAMWFHSVVFRADRIVDFATHGAAARAALPTCRFD